MLDYVILAYRTAKRCSLRSSKGEKGDGVCD